MLQGYVFLVSKNGFFRHGLKQALAGGTLTFAGEEISADAALGFLQSTHQTIDLIVVDADALDGSVSLKAISDQYPQISIVMLSAASEPERIVAAVRAGHHTPALQEAMVS